MASPVYGDQNKVRTDDALGVLAEGAVEQPFVSKLEALTLDQSGMYGTMATQAALFDPSMSSGQLRESARQYDQDLQTQAAGLDDLATEATDGPLQSAAASQNAIAQSSLAARAAALGARGDAALLARESDFAQGAANRRASQLAKVAAIAETDARRGVAADATMAASGLGDAAARSAAGAETAAADIDTRGAAALGQNAETRERGALGDAAVRGEVAATASELAGRGLDTRETIGNEIWRGESESRAIGRGQGLANAQNSRAENQANMQAVGTGIQTAGSGVASLPKTSYGPERPYSEDPEVVQSDPQAKQDVHPLAKVNAYQFDYKPGMGHKRGPQIGVMADELERDPVANSLVSRGPDGLRQVDTGGAAMMALASSAAQDKRISKLEKLLRANA